MNSEFIQDRLRPRGYAISMDDLFTNKLNKLIDNGLRVLTLCYDGTGRSRTAADTLSESYDIPSVRLDGGIRQIVTNEDLWSEAAYIQYAINACPMVAVILTPEEMKKHYNFLSNIRALKYTNSQLAIASISKIEGK